jgi:hypothetical protein
VAAALILQPQHPVSQFWPCQLKALQSRRAAGVEHAHIVTTSWVCCGLAAVASLRSVASTAQEDTDSTLEVIRTASLRMGLTFKAGSEVTGQLGSQPVSQPSSKPGRQAATNLPFAARCPNFGRRRSAGCSH